MGVAVGYSLLAYESLNRGLHKLEANPEKLASELDGQWDLLAEPVQTVMRKYGITNAYEQLKDLTRGKGGIDQESMQAFIRTLPLPPDEIELLLALSPATYTGLAAVLAANVRP
jgi:adenylosuccinate lyase